MTSQALTKSIQALTGERKLHFFDAVAPIVYRDSIDMSVAFRQNRWQKAEDGTPEGDYINCPMNADRYAAFVDAVRSAESNALSKADADLERYFEGCLPIEVLAHRGEDALAFGPMRPVGLRDPRTGHRPHAVVQLRQDNAAASLYNLVGFQTNIKWGRQEEILRLIPGLERGRFARMGQMHRNTFISSPDLLLPTMQSRIRDNLFFAGQITGTEGYVGSTMGGLVCGLNMDRMLDNRSPWTFSRGNHGGSPAPLHHPYRCPPLPAHEGQHGPAAGTARAGAAQAGTLPGLLRTGAAGAVRLHAGRPVHTPGPWTRRTSTW